MKDNSIKIKSPVLLFLLIPAVQVVSDLRYFDSYYQIISSIIFISSDFILSLLLYNISKYFVDKNSRTIQLLYFAVLTVLDQGNKLFLELTNLNCRIIGELFQIRQTRNVNQIAFLNHFQISIDIEIIISFKIILFVLVTLAFFKAKNKYFSSGCVLLMAAQLSNTIDSCLRGYVLDSFYYYRLVCYDLKDYYVDAGVIMIAFYFISRQTANKTKSDV